MNDKKWYRGELRTNMRSTGERRETMKSRVFVLLTALALLLVLSPVEGLALAPGPMPATHAQALAEEPPLPGFPLAAGSPPFRAASMPMPASSGVEALITQAGQAAQSGDYKILFDETHGYASDYAGNYIIEDTLSDLAALLSEAGATVDSLTSPATFDYATISQYDVLALVLPQSSYSTQERADINTFVQNGGRLVVVGDWGGWTPADTARPILNEVLSGLGTGIALNADTVYDPTNNDGEAYWPIIHQFSTDSVNQEVGQVVEFAAGSLGVGSPGYATAWADDDAYVSLTAFSTVERNGAGLSPRSPAPPAQPEGEFVVNGVVSDTPPPPTPEATPGEPPGSGWPLPTGCHDHQL
jgi:hypothetical protein